MKKQKAQTFKWATVDIPPRFEFKEASRNPLNGKLDITFVRKGSEFSSKPKTKA